MPRASRGVLAVVTVLAAWSLLRQVAAVTSQPRLEEWDARSAGPFGLTAPAGGSAVPGVADPGATDGRVLALTIPAGAGAGPGSAAEAESRARFRYGSVDVRMRTVDCSGQPLAGVVTGAFTYANDGADHDGDGLTDNGELDVEVLCARPSVVHLSIWTDYRRSDGAQRRVTRSVDLATGRVLATRWVTRAGEDGRALGGAESAPAQVRAVPGFDAAAAFHTYRIDWNPHRVAFALVGGGRVTTLWDYRGPRSRIPQAPAAFLVNVWHTADWPPDGAPAAVRPPARPVRAAVDTVRLPGPA